MPRIVFATVGALELWCDRFVSDDKYVGYFTSKKELILEPTKSTHPLRYAYCKADGTQDFARKLTKDQRITVFMVESYEWDTERGVGIKVNVE